MDKSYHDGADYFRQVSRGFFFSESGADIVVDFYV